MKSSNWTDDELLESVKTYIEMLHKERNGEPYVKSHHIRRLASKLPNRSEKSCEYRMQNISFVLSLMGRRWITGYKPAKNVGTNIAKQIESLIYAVEEQSFPERVGFETSIRTLLKKNLPKPEGSQNPTKKNSQVTSFQRDPKVAAWVLQQAKGKCESCLEPAPFSKDDGSPFLEVHHLRRLADGGSDTATNTVALCPNCHREFHYGKNRELLLADIYYRVSRLVKED